MFKNMPLTFNSNTTYLCFDLDFGLCVATLTDEGQLGLDSCTSPPVLSEVRTAAENQTI